MLTPVEMKTENGSKLELQKDGSVFVHQPATTDTYSLVFQTELKGIKGLRLEALADGRLPGGGPGWGRSGWDGNFVLSKLSLHAAPAENPDQTRSIALRNASANFSQKGYNVRLAVEGKGNQGWAVGREMGKDHVAVFDTAVEVGDGRTMRLTVRLDHKYTSLKTFLLGRFRLSFTTDAATLQVTRIRSDLNDSESIDLYAALGTAHAQQGQSDEAVAAFAQGLALATDRAGKARIIAAAAPLPGVLEKLAERADNSERLTFAQIAFDQKKFALATRLWAEALASDPKLGDDREKQHRYNAARAAALAAAGPGKDEPPLDEAAKAKLRGQALDWLKAEFAARTKQEPRAGMVQILWRWQQDSDLAGIRDNAALGKLPAEEQQAFTEFWADVAKTAAPANNTERLVVAQFAYDQKNFAFATRLWADALASDRQLGDQPEFLTKATADNPKSPAAEWLVLTLAHAKLKENDQARKACGKAAELLKPNGAEAALRPLLHEVLIAVGPNGPDATTLIAAAAGEPPAALNDAIQQNPDNAAGYQKRGDWFGQRGQWQKAIADFTELYRLEPTAYTGLQLGILLAYTGEIDRYRAHCQAMLQRWASTQTNSDADRTLKTILLLPDFQGDAMQLARLAEVAVSGDKNAEWFEWYLFAKGLHDYRTGEYADAVTTCRESQRRVPKNNSSPQALAAMNLAIEAMALHRSRDEAGAKRALAEAKSNVGDNVPGIDGWDGNWLTAHLLCHEAEGLIASKKVDRPK